MNRSLSGDALFQALDATWPPFDAQTNGIWTLREGKGAGKRVSSASTIEVPTHSDIESAASAIKALGQIPMFMVRGDQPELDGQLEHLGYHIIDPVDIFVAPSAELADYDRSRLELIFAEEPMPILAEIWQDAGIGGPRLDVMRRVGGAKTYLFGRKRDRAAASGFAACHNNICMIHAVEVLARLRRQGVAERLMRGAAWWAQQQGVEFTVALTTSENIPAQNLYRKMGMEVAAHYHYRVGTSS